MSPRRPRRIVTSKDFRHPTIVLSVPRTGNRAPQGAESPQGCLNVRFRRSGRRRHLSQRQHSLDVVGQLPQSLADRAVARAPQQVHDDRSQEGEHRGTDSVIRSGLIGCSRAGVGHWQGEIPLTKPNAVRPAKGYGDRQLGDPGNPPKSPPRSDDSSATSARITLHPPRLDALTRSRADHVRRFSRGTVVVLSVQAA